MFRTPCGSSNIGIGMSLRILKYIEIKVYILIKFCKVITYGACFLQTLEHVHLAAELLQLPCLVCGELDLFIKLLIHSQILLLESVVFLAQLVEAHLTLSQARCPVSLLPSW